MTHSTHHQSAEIRLVAIVQAKPGQEKVVADILKAAIEPSRKEAGCLEYMLHEDQNVLGRFVFIERWSDADALAAHEQTEHFLRLGQLLPPHIEGESEILRLRQTG